MHPFILGTGKRLLDATPTRHDLHLATTVTTPTGLAILTYERTR